MGCGCSGRIGRAGCDAGPPARPRIGHVGCPICGADVSDVIEQAVKDTIEVLIKDTIEVLVDVADVPGLRLRQVITWPVTGSAGRPDAGASRRHIGQRGLL